MIRFTLLVTALYGICCVMAWGQPAAPPRDGEAAAPVPATTPAPDRRDGPITIPHGGSILKATLAHDPTKEDPDRVKYSDISVLAVPPPKPAGHQEARIGHDHHPR